MRHLSLFLGLNLCFALLAAQKGAAQNNAIVDVGVFNAPISNVQPGSHSEIHGVGIQQENILD